MHHSRHFFIAIAVLILSLLLVVGVAAAQGPEGEYQGAEACSSCHRGISNHYEGAHALALQSGAAPAQLAADFSAGETARTIQFPGEAAARAFTQADVAYIIGMGRYAQRFVWEAEDGTLYVIPAEWNAVTDEWSALQLGDETWPAASYDFGQNCVYCHTTGLDRETITWQDDGVWCEACHGPGEEHITLAREAGINPGSAAIGTIRGAIFNSPDGQVCAQCHAVGTAPDGRPYPDGYIPGSDLFAEDVYTAVAVEDDVHWWTSGHAAIQSMQGNEWLNSAHSDSPAELLENDHASDDCLRCHSADYRYAERIRADVEAGILRNPAPETITLETATSGIACQVCHNPHSTMDDDRDPNLMFNLVNEPYALCISCHSNQTIQGFVHHPNQEMHEGLSLHAEIAAIPGAHFGAEDGPDCVSCHMPRLPVDAHDRASHALLNVMPDAPEALESVAGCTSCHDDVAPEVMGTFISETQASIEGRLERAEALLTDDTPEWVSVALNMVARDGSLGLHNYTYTAALLSNAEVELDIPTQVAAAAEPAEETNWVTLPGIGELDGVTAVGLGAYLLAYPILLIAGLYFVTRKGGQRLLGIVLLLGIVALIAVAVVMLNQPEATVPVSADNGYCAICHSAERSFTLADGNMISLHATAEVVAASVHGSDSEAGMFGCLTCHTDAYPHDTAPTSLRNYRLSGVNICLQCHSDSQDHYDDVRARNIAVSCVDCHGSHAVQSADTLDRTPLSEEAETATP